VIVDDVLGPYRRGRYEHRLAVEGLHARKHGRYGYDVPPDATQFDQVPELERQLRKIRSDDRNQCRGHDYDQKRNPGNEGDIESHPVEHQQRCSHQHQGVQRENGNQRIAFIGQPWQKNLDHKLVQKIDQHDRDQDEIETANDHCPELVEVRERVGQLR
jgi:hypothetical protein